MSHRPVRCFLSDLSCALTGVPAGLMGSQVPERLSVSRGELDAEIRGQDHGQVGGPDSACLAYPAGVDEGQLVAEQGAPEGVAHLLDDQPLGERLAGSTLAPPTLTAPTVCLLLVMQRWTANESQTQGRRSWQGRQRARRPLRDQPARGEPGADGRPGICAGAPTIEHGTAWMCS